MTYGRDSIRDGLFEEIGREAERLGLMRRLHRRGAGGIACADAGGRGADEDVWVFGYGSLMWNPAFNYASAGRA